MELIEVAEKHNLKVQKIEGELVVAGRQAKRNDDRYPAPNIDYPLDNLLGHIFEYSSTRLGLVFMPRIAKVWKNLSGKLLASGFEIRQNGDWEGVATFDPADLAQVQLAIKAIGARKKRQMSKAQLKNLAGRGTLITPENPSIEPPSTLPELIGTPGVLSEHGPEIVGALNPVLSGPDRRNAQQDQATPG